MPPTEPDDQQEDLRSEAVEIAGLAQLLVEADE